MTTHEDELEPLVGEDRRFHGVHKSLGQRQQPGLGRQGAVAAARAILDAGIDRRLDLALLDLTYLEFGNALVRSRALSAEQTTELLDRVRLVCGEGIRVTSGELARIAQLAATHRLSFYDAAYWGVAEGRVLDLVTADGVTAYRIELPEDALRAPPGQLRQVIQRESLDLA